MKRNVKILIAAAAAVAAIAGGGIGYHAYDVNASGFAEDTYEICPEETVLPTLQLEREGLRWEIGNEEIAKIGEEGAGEITGVSPGETTVTARLGIHRYRCRLVVREHSYVDADCVTPKTCELCALTEGEPLGHESGEATCTEPGLCLRCGEEVEEALGHVEQIKDCLAPVVCSRCKEEIGEAPGHDFVEATCTEPEICSRCKEEKGEPLGHDFEEATCTDPKTCKRCGEKEGKALGHDLERVSCLEAQVCKRCGESVGEAPGHDFAEATCTEPKTCKYCKEKEGEALGHTFAEATCEKPSTCQRCGETTGNALGHHYELVDSGTQGNQNYERYVCSVCKKEDIKYQDIAQDSSAIYSAMIGLKSSYPDGTPWTNENFYAWKGGIYSGGYGCAGFAFMLSDAAFGNARARLYYDASQVRVGDIVRMNGNTHSVIVLEVNSDSVTVAEGNYNGGVHWGRKISMSSLAGADYFMTRY
ncbi:MAG: hypothetical protein NC400_04215 [Clostridium sp.]|nr:hypothetical protein [Clostridium sp.]